MIETYENNSKIKKLQELVYTLINHSAHKHDLSKLMNRSGLTDKEVIQGYLRYNTDIFSFDNEVYNSMANRFVLHLHNLQKNSFHEEKQNVIIEMLNQIKPKNVIDIGFGVPSKYVQRLALKNKKFKVVLNDFFDIAFQFASILLEQWDPNWQEMVSFKQADMSDAHLFGNFDVYLFQESIEHVKNPTTCLKEYVKIASNSAKFILYLPINAPIPAHYIVWDTDKEADLWLQECNLKIENKIYIRPNKTVDLFADVLDFDYYNVLYLCSKL